MARHKACLVAKGFAQVEGINFNDIFSLIAQMEQFKLCSQLWPLKISKCIKWMLNYFFEWRYFKRNIYAITKGLCDEGYKEYSMYLKKYLYGLKQFPYEWNHKINVYFLF
jgi:hypothetical protein